MLRQRSLLMVLVLTLLLATFPQAFWGGEIRAASNPFSGIVWYPNPYSPVTTQASTWRASRPADALLLDRIAAQQTVDWIGGWLSPDAMTSWVRQLINAAPAGGVPMLSAYNIPRLDCGDGGAASATDYRTWIERFARAVASTQHKAIVMLEPDGLTVTDCLNPAQLAERYALIAYGVELLKSNPNVSVYIDGGEWGRFSIEEVANILTAGNIAKADGFLLNSTRYDYTSRELAYGVGIGKRLGGKHFIVDTTANGLGSRDTPCNSRQHTLGLPPTTQTGEPLADAFVWNSQVWHSAGDCGRGDPSAGQDFFEYARFLSARTQQPFTDTPDDAVSQEAIRQLAQRGVLRGNGDGTIGANSSTLRAQMAGLIARAMTWELEGYGGTLFPDQVNVDNELWHSVGTLAHYNVAQGFADGTYHPTEPVLYEQVLLFISRAMVAKEYWVLQADVPSMFPNLPNGTAREQADRRDIATYVYYTQARGGVPDRPATGDFTGWDQPAPRSWFARALWAALDSYYTTLP